MCLNNKNTKMIISNHWQPALLNNLLTRILETCTDWPDTIDSSDELIDWKYTNDNERLGWFPLECQKWSGTWEHFPRLSVHFFSNFYVVYLSLHSLFPSWSAAGTRDLMRYFWMPWGALMACGTRSLTSPTIVYNVTDNNWLSHTRKSLYCKFLQAYESRPTGSDRLVNEQFFFQGTKYRFCFR